MSKIIDLEALKAFREKTDNRYTFPDGVYENMSVGNADQLNSTLFTENKEPYNIRTSGGSADVGNRMYDEVVGGSVFYRNFMKNYNISGSHRGISLNYISSTGVITLNGTANSSGILDIGGGLCGAFIPTNHYYIVLVNKITSDYKVGSNPNTYYLKNTGNGTDMYLTKLSDGTYFYRRQATVASANLGIVVNTGVTFDNLKFKIMFLDTTSMFGYGVASYLNSLDTKTLGDLFKSWFPKDWYGASDSNIGALWNSRPSKHINIGFNAFNIETGTAKLLGGKEYQITGIYSSVTYEDINGDSETLTIDENGIFTPLKNGTLTIIGGNDSDTCVHLVWSGYRNGDYEPYKEYSYNLDPGGVLRGVLKKDENNNLYFDGDIYKADGTIIRKYEYRDYQSGDWTDTNVITNGNKTVAPLENPVIEQGVPYQSFQIIDDFGTEEYVNYSGGDRLFGHITKYAPNLRDKLQNLPNIPETTGDYIVHYDSTDRTCTFIAKTSDLPTLPETDGSYLLKCTVADGQATLTWEAQV